MYPDFYAKVDQNKYFNAIFGHVHSLFHFAPCSHQLKSGEKGFEPFFEPLFPIRLTRTHLFPSQLEVCPIPNKP
jgi:hypothetical protein